MMMLHDLEAIPAQTPNSTGTAFMSGAMKRKQEGSQTFRPATHPSEQPRPTFFLSGSEYRSSTQKNKRAKPDLQQCSLAGLASRPQRKCFQHQGSACAADFGARGLFATEGLVDQIAEPGPALL